MSESAVSTVQGTANASSAPFLQLVAQQANMAMMMLGLVPHPGSGKTSRDLDAAKMFIDQIEALQQKTKGNLTREEEKMLNQTVMSLQLAFVEAVESPSAPSADAPSGETPAAAAASAGSETAAAGTAAPEEEPRKRFSKKY